MYTNDTRKRLEDIIRGIAIEGQEDNCSAARNLLCTSFETSTTVKKDFGNQSKIKEEQSKLLKVFITTNNLWLNHFPEENRYISEGGEAKIYLDNNNRSVIKLNDAVYYST
jgi:Serine/Threonine/Tyrosine Kinase found in polyvalent proteins